MSLMTQAHLLERYGVRLSTTDVAEVLGLSAGTVRNKISAGVFPIKSYVEACGMLRPRPKSSR